MPLPSRLQSPEAAARLAEARAKAEEDERARVDAERQALADRMAREKATPAR